MIPYRDFQSKLDDDIENAWASGARIVMPVLPTGGGKTTVIANNIARHNEPAIAIAHRQELVGQMSRAFARCDVPHRIIAPQPIIKRIIGLQVAECGTSYYHSNAPIAVAGVDTVVRRPQELGDFMNKIRRFVIDEGHHVLRGNKWGKAIGMLPPDVRGMLPTATPDRADGKGLGRHADGVVDAMILGPHMRQIINDGWLTDYRIFCPQGDYHRPDNSRENLSADGDLKKTVVKASIRKSHIVGNIVEKYSDIAPGKLGVTFASDVETATDIAAQFHQAGVPCEVVSAKTPDHIRAAILARFARRELLMLVNVDLFGEGFDLPAIEVVIMARPTESFALYCQQFGRALRLMLNGPAPSTVAGRLAAIAASSKPRAIIIDHVGNVVRHGLPDARTEWTLDARDKRSRGKPNDVTPMRECLNPVCMAVYERFYPTCPYCGDKPTPSSRSAPEFVDGDLTELDPVVLAQMRGEVLRVDMDPAEYRAELAAKHCPPVGQLAHVNRHIARQEAQQGLRSSMAWWAAFHRDAGRSDAESYRRFYHQFGIDALSAQSLDTQDAQVLAGRINETLMKGVI